MSSFGWKSFSFADLAPWAGTPAEPSGPSPDVDLLVERARECPGFAELIAPVSVEHFFTHHFEQRPLHCTGRAGLGGIDRARVERMPEDHREHLPGGSIIAHLAERFIPEVEELAVLLEDVFTSPVSGNLFYSVPAEAALPAHWDTQEVFVFQIEGRKRWRFWPYREAHAWRERTDRFSEPPDAELTLSPGDLFYLPRGRPHAALAEGPGPSLHLSLAVFVPTHLDVLRLALERALDELADEPALRRFAPVLLGEAGAERVGARLAPHLAPLLDAAPRWLAAGARRHLGEYDHREGYLARRARREAIERLGGRLPDLRGSYRRRTGLARLAPGPGETFRLQARGFAVDVPEVALDPLRQLLRLSRFRARELGSSVEGVALALQLAVTLGVVVEEEP